MSSSTVDGLEIATGRCTGARALWLPCPKRRGFPTNLPIVNEPSQESATDHFTVGRSSTLSPIGADDGVEIVVASLAASPEAVDASMALLAPDERRRATSFVFARDRRRFIRARSRLRELLGARLGEEPESIRLGYGVRGKPALAHPRPNADLRFNVSHCDDLAVYAFSIGRELGIDVEFVRAVPEADEIAERLFSRFERAAYRRLAPADRPLGFFNAWTRKEAFIKAIGDGLSHPLHHFDVSLAPGEPARILRVLDTPGDRCGWRMRAWIPASGFVAAVVVQDPACGSAPDEEDAY